MESYHLIILSLIWTTQKGARFNSDALFIIPNSENSLPLHEHRDVCYVVGILTLKAKGMLCQEYSKDNSSRLPTLYSCNSIL
jgi:hypothetical protein